MHTEQILTHVARHITLDVAERDFFISLLQFRIMKKKEILIREGDVCHHEHYVIKGCFKSYSVDEKGNEHIIMFAPEDWWMGDLYSFLTGKPSRFHTVALEASEIFMISKPDLQRLYETVPKFERFFRILFQSALVAQFHRIDQNLSMTAEERYNEFQNRYPLLEQRIPLKQIASFLGITPEFLSTIRRKGMRGKG